MDLPDRIDNEEQLEDVLTTPSRALAADLFGYPEVPLERMIRWTAHWVDSGGRGLGKPTHWEVNDGRY